MVAGRTDEIMIEGHEVEKVFKDFWGRPKVHALRGVDIMVPAGSVFGLLGPNGAGKSTLIKIMLGHLYCSHGYMRVIGRNPRDVEVKQRIGYLPERTSFYTNLTTLETLLFFGRLLGIADAEIKRRSRQLIKMVGLENAVDRLVGEFSHGMRKRLGLAQALLNDPDLLLLDEPTAGLDPLGCREIKDLILTLGKRGKTVLMTSHLLADVEDVCDTIMILYGGRVQASGEISQLLAKRDELLIRSPIVGEPTLAEVKELLSREVDTGSLRISFPTRTLEDYFISVVMDADRRNEGTSGAGLGEGIASYLADAASERVPDGVGGNVEAVSKSIVPEPELKKTFPADRDGIPQEEPPAVAREPAPLTTPEKDNSMVKTESATPLTDESMLGKEVQPDPFSATDSPVSLESESQVSAIAGSSERSAGATVSTVPAEVLNEVLTSDATPPVKASRPSGSAVDLNELAALSGAGVVRDDDDVGAEPAIDYKLLDSLTKKR